MKKILLLLPLILLNACMSGDSGNWSNDCWTYYSTNRRELSECMKRVEAGRLLEVQPGEIKIDPHNETIPDENEIGKSRTGKIV